MQGKVKKIVVRGFDPKKTKERQENYYHDTLKKLDVALSVIMSGLGLNSGYQELYVGVQNLVRAGQTESCLELLLRHCQKGIAELKELALASISTAVDESCKAVIHCWRQWTERIELIHNIFYYMDRAYLIRVAGQTSILEFSVSLFRDDFMSFDEIRVPFLNQLTSLFEQLRNGNNVDKTLLKDASKMLQQTHLFDKLFFPMYLCSLETNYTSASQAELQKVPLDEFLLYIERCLKHEEDIVHEMFADNVLVDVNAVLDRCLVSQHISSMTPGLKDFVLKRKTDSCKSLYTLLKRVDETKLLCDPWSQGIVALGSSLVNDPNHDDSLISELLEIHIFLKDVLKHAFLGDEALSYSMRKSFETFLSSLPSTRREKPAELLAKYIDHLMRSTKSVVGNNTFDNVCAELLDIFRYLPNKDVFEAFYKRDVAKRLLLNKSANTDNERKLLEMLKEKCGSTFTHSLEGMFKDVDFSKDFSKSFKESKFGRSLHYDLFVNVLSLAYWPTYPDTTITLPPELETDLDIFKNFYLSQQTARRLAWRPALCYCLLKAEFPSGSKELSVSLFQACVLLLFNDVGDEGLSYVDIQKRTQLNDNDLTRTLQSLCCAHVRPLLMQPKSRRITKEHRFFYNQHFTNPHFRIKINQIQLRESKEEKASVQEEVVRDRQFELQACVVRLMKANKTMTYNQLVRQTMDYLQIRGKPDLSEVKKGIEKLIEKEYIERTDDTNLAYVA
ncbi:Cullin 4 [Schizosaccharomyces japonicus yFS275]|uniref:Cullin 4 n=1 Tax=Schizosaccharomyces japonicus (strain yFS275 / FY16936) TaxID=402676 RepID=B6JY81_SCHJY|nr:Cullin 4 [Schizosaccharomyces japonicus yFS275]EEB06499.1 Cullin 4 [Schizosaccharomyces japonicus yFS275]